LTISRVARPLNPARLTFPAKVARSGGGSCIAGHWGAVVAGPKQSKRRSRSADGASHIGRATVPPQNWEQEQEQELKRMKAEAGGSLCDACWTQFGEALAMVHHSQQFADWHLSKQ
jgi:hypothetical protein